VAFPRLKPTQYAGYGSEGWQIFDTLEEAGEYARQRMAGQSSGEYKVYDARHQLVKTAALDPPRGELRNAGPGNEPKPWWKLWK